MTATPPAAGAAGAPNVLADRIASIRGELTAVGRPDVRIIGVSKTFPVSAIEQAHAAGLADFGESYAQEFLAKVPEMDHTALRWHFIGGLQRNKVRKIAPYVDLWHSVDRSSLVGEIANRAPGAHVLLQVDIFGEEQKGGCAPRDVEGLLGEAIERGLVVDGLMAMAPYGDPEAARPGFRTLNTMADELHLVERSMGMSGDYLVAASEGATMVRIGSAIFGDRAGDRAKAPGSHLE